MKRIAVFVIPTAIFVAGLLLGAFALGGDQSAQASVPLQERGDGWAVENFRSITFEPSKWENIGQVGSCVAFSSQAKFGDPAVVSVRTETEDFELAYRNRGARVIACAGFTAFFPPLNAGLPPERES